MSWLSKILDELKKRKTIILDKPLISKFEGQIKGYNAGLQQLVEAKKQEWRSRGLTENQIQMAENLAEEWTYSMSRTFAPPEVQEAAFKQNLPRGLDVADRWVKGLMGK